MKENPMADNQLPPRPLRRERGPGGEGDACPLCSHLRACPPMNFLRARLGRRALLELVLSGRPTLDLSSHER